MSKRETREMSGLVAQKSPSAASLEAECAVSLAPSLGPPPDGGFTAWAQVVAGLFCSFNSWGITNSFGVYQQVYGTTILPGETPSRISWIGSLLGILSYLGAPLFGFWIDKGYARVMCITASIVASFSWMMLSLSTEYYQFILTQGVLAGLCSSVLFSCAISAVTPYFSRHRAIALGIATSGTSLGGIVYSIVTQETLNRLGFAWSCRINGFILLATGATSGFLLRPRIDPRKMANRGYFAHECFRELPFMLHCIAMFFAFLGLYIFYDYVQAHAFDVDGHRPSYGYLAAILNGASMIGRLFPSMLADKVGMSTVFIPSCLLTATLMFSWIAAKNEPGILAVTVICGVVSGPVAIAQSVIAAKLTKDMERLGIRISFAFIFFGLGIMFGPPFAGMMVLNHGYMGAQLYGACAMVVAAVLGLACRTVALRKEGLSQWTRF